MSPLVQNILKYGLLTVTAPLWWPILKALWNELQAALWREGGLVGRAPTPQEMPVLEERYRAFASPLINETYAEFRVREEREEQERVDAKRNGKRKRGTGDDEAGARGSRGAGGQQALRPAARRTAQRPASRPGRAPSSAERPHVRRAGGGGGSSGGVRRRTF